MIVAIFDGKKILVILMLRIFSYFVKYWFIHVVDVVIILIGISISA